MKQRQSVEKARQYALKITNINTVLSIHAVNFDWLCIIFLWQLFLDLLGTI